MIAIEVLFASAVGVMTAAGIYLVLQLRTFPVILGLSFLSYAVNVFLFATGRLVVNQPPVLTKYAESYTDALPDLVKLAEACQWVGLRATKPDEVDDVIKEMIEIDRPVIADIWVDQTENCFPMIPSGAAHNDMLLGPEDEAAKPVSEEGMVLV